MPPEEQLPPVIEKSPRLQVVPETHRASINEFLRHFLNRFELDLNDKRALAFQFRTDAYENEIRYLRYKVATVKALLYYNEQRRKRGKVS